MRPARGNPLTFEGTGFFLGADLNLDFGDFPSSDTMPRVLELFPVDVSGRENVQLTVSLAGSDVDFEDTDFLRVSVDVDNSGEFVTLSEFRGNANKALDDGTTQLSPSQFQDVTWDIPSGATNLVVRFEAHDSFTNELIAIDNLHITAGGVVLQAGDADQDFDFDQLDLVQVQTAAKYLTGQPATWGDGDWNGAPSGEPGSPPPGDGIFDQRDVIAALAAGVYLTGPYGTIQPEGTENDAQTSIIYNTTTGELAVDAPAGSELTSVNIDSASGIFTGQAAQDLGGSFDNDADNNIFKATFGSSFGSLSFGNVAQPGLSEEFVAGDLTVVGSLAGGGDLGNVDLIYVPEPSTATLVLLGALGFAAWQRRQ